MKNTSAALLTAGAVIALSVAFGTAFAAPGPDDYKRTMTSGIVLAADNVPAAAVPAPVQPADMSGTVAVDTVADPVNTLKGVKVVNVNGDTVGEVREVVLGTDGKVGGVQVEAGGFLGVGEKVVTFDPENFVWHPGDKELVTRLTKDDVKALAGLAAVMIQTSDVPNSVAVNAAPAGAGYGSATVQNLEGDKIGTVKQVVQTTRGVPVAFDVDVGGFLGMGERIVRVDANHFVYVPASNLLVTRMDKGQVKDLTDAVGEPVRSIELAGSVPANTVANAAKTFENLRVESLNGDKVGDVQNIYVSTDGHAQVLLLEVGGFLGMGQKDVRVSARNLAFLADRNVLVTALTKDDLTALPDVDDGEYSGEPAPVTVTANTVGDPATVFEGVKLENPDGTDVGDVSKVTVGADGKAATIDANVGGFLGVGEKVVTFNADALQYNAESKVLITTLTKEQVEALPAVAP